MKYSSTALSMALALSFASFGCGAADRVDNRLDCRQICDRYAECFDSEYDVDGCKSDCRDNANSDNSFESKVEACSDCLDGNDSCTKDGFECAKECVAIVP